MKDEVKKVIPVTILTWFLGSGKTTLLNKILDNKQWYKIAVIENEYGEESIDSELIRQDVAELIEIKDGCMCCVVRWDLMAWVEKLLNSWKEIDYIIIEASWMSEPMPVAQTFIIETFGWRTRLDSIVCVVDAQNFHNKIVQSLQTTYEQIESSHFIILNKIEGLAAEKVEEIKKAVRKINPYSAIIESNYCEVDINYVLDTDLFKIEEDSSEKSHDYHDHKHHSHDHNDHEHSHPSHGHRDDKKQMQTSLFKTNIPCYGLENIKHFLSEVSENIFRMKWFICFKNYPGERYILQKAGSCFTLAKDEQWNKKNTESKIVFIWKHIDTQILQDTLLKDVFFD